MTSYTRHIGEGNGSSGGAPARPAPMPVVADNVPESLRRLDRWVCWRWVWKPKKNAGRGGWDKPPYDPRTGDLASSIDPGTWAPFAVALAAHRAGRYDGIGITLGPVDDGGPTLAGVDLDDVRDPGTGRLAEWVAWVARRLDTYAEVSPSGGGVKLLCWGAPLPRGRHADHERGVEMYDGARYFTVTGHRLDGAPAEVMERTEVLAQLHAELLGEPDLSHGVAAGGSDRELALAALAGLSTRRAVGYGDWLAVGMALHSVDPSEAMLAEWDRWSQAAPEKYQEGGCAAKWRTFGRGGLKLGSLVYWARQDGWTPPGRKGLNGRRAPPDRPEDEAGDDGPEAPEGGRRPSTVRVLREWIRTEYEPTFRRGPLLYSARLGREVRPQEVTGYPPSGLIARLVGAADAPRDKRGHVDVQALPGHHRRWAPTAWADVLRALKEEEDAGEVDDSAAEQFRRRLTAALVTVVALGHTYRDSDGGERTETQRRAVIDWAALWAHAGPWRDVRSYRLWHKLDDRGRLQVALRVELFAQLGRRELADLSQRQLTALAERYGLGRPGKAKGERVLVLDPGYVAQVRSGPAAVDGWTEPDGQEPSRESGAQAPNSAEGEPPPGDTVDDCPGAGGTPSTAAPKPAPENGRMDGRVGAPPTGAPTHAGAGGGATGEKREGDSDGRLGRDPGGGG